VTNWNWIQVRCKVFQRVLPKKPTRFFGIIRVSEPWRPGKSALRRPPLEGQADVGTQTQIIKPLWAVVQLSYSQWCVSVLLQFTLLYVCVLVILSSSCQQTSYMLSVVCRPSSSMYARLITSSTRQSSAFSFQTFSDQSQVSCFAFCMLVSFSL